MANPPGVKVTIIKRTTNSYTIGLSTNDGEISAKVSVATGVRLDPRSEKDKKSAALGKAKRLAKALNDAIDALDVIEIEEK